MLKNVSFPAKISVMVLGSLAILTIFFAAIAYVVLSEEGTRRAVDRQEVNMRVAWDVLGAYGDTFRLQDGKIYVGSAALNDDNGPVDKIKDLVGGTATVFMGDTRVATNVKKPDGSRAVGTKLAPGPVYDSVLKDGKPFRGEADILGTAYFTAYDPIKDASGKTIGILYTGVKRDDFFQSVNTLQIQMGLTAAVVAVILGAAALFLSRRIFAPLRTLTGTIAAVAGRRTDVPVEGTERKDEIGQIARAVDNMRESLAASDRLEAEAKAAREAQTAERERQMAAEHAKAEELSAFVHD
ncbi:cache domain-containing protein, partial [Aurantimonas sp. MSK8Z-1]|uniref:cache domain-containing protein n=1 Tax=Mangrovibrevibacter kandeliae TaxID=2968473 RepID=UPI002232238F